MLDADYIREAELHGIPSPPPIFCRLCGKECSEIFISTEDQEPVGCDRCIEVIDAAEWEGRD